eukprot:CAMPEP_0172384894 /NCGR_PEP_ID=MMETSP1061-20121228/2590_1 /TAXON_ID=37318 /ORGANISM="Pseudo-nitzschia pungens, Strain cf. pungens" /LENGTH=298 /DNA_ID=CAMNT_0013113675 /DNA_START=189 /DNA_END=1085 /DNA_ORIENTATION=-
MAKLPVKILLAGIAILTCDGFQNSIHVMNKLRVDHCNVRGAGVVCSASRRDLLSLFVPATLASMALLTPNEPAFADSESEGDLTSKMFNADGSLKEGVESEVKFREVSFKWDASDAFAMNEDGTNVQDTKSGSQYELYYEYPMRWSDGKDGDPIYFDRAEGINKKAAKRITIFQAPGKVTPDRLEKATTIGVAKALDAPQELSRLYKADVVSGRSVTKGSQKYYEFDMAAAPDTCGDSKENLGLGFCPYDDLFLLSATVMNDRLYCIVVECDSTRVWKQESKELKRIRSTFVIDEVTA